jgi:hypothetical protein
MRRYDIEILRSNRRLNQQANQLLKGKRIKKPKQRAKPFKNYFSKQERKEYGEMMRRFKSL